MSAPNVYLRELGSPQAPAVVLLHGQFFDGDYYEPLWSRLVEQHRLLVPDLPGWGRSALCSPHDAGHVSRALEASIVERGVTSADIVGSSVGAYHALALALSRRLNVGRLALLGGLGGLDAPECAAFAEYSRAAHAGTPLGNAYVFLAFSNAWRALNATRCARLSSSIDAMPKSNVAADLELMATLPDLRPQLPGLSARVLLRVGELDLSTPPAKSEELKQLLPSGVLEVVPGVGHALLLEDSDATTESLMRFLN